MNKLLFLVIVAVVVSFSLGALIMSLRDVTPTIITVEKAVPVLSGVVDSINYSGVYTATTTCGVFNASGTANVIVVTTTNRTSFVFQNAGSSSVRLCRNSVCGIVAHEGIAGWGQIIAGTSTLAASRYVQEDGYIGPYACSGLGNVASSNAYIEEGRQ